MSIEYGQLTLSIRPKSGDSPSLPMRDFGLAIDAIVTIHDSLFRISHPDAKYIPSPVITEISKQSPAWLKLISFKDIVDAITGLLKIPGELESQRAENSKLAKEIEQIDTLISIDKNRSSSMEATLVQERTIMEEKLRQERIRTVSLYHETVVKVMESYILVCKSQPVAADHLAPVTFAVTKALGEIVNSELFISVEHVENVEHNIATDLGFPQISTLLVQRDASSLQYED